MTWPRTAPSRWPRQPSGSRTITCAALESNRDIGVAIGILMATKLVTKLVTQQEAFDALRITSQHTHRKLHLVALKVTETGELPGFLPLAPAPRPLNLS